MQKTAAVLSLIAIFAVSAYSQFPQMRRAQERMDGLRKADEKRQKEQEAADNAAISLPKPKPAVLNVDVQAVLTTRDLKTFTEAKANAVKEISDGDPVWLNVKFNGKLGDYVRTVRDEENDGQLRYLLFAEVGPKGDITALSRYVLEFSKEELSASELKINLAPGLPGRNAASPVLIDVAGTRQPGVWNNEIRLANSTIMPRSAKDNLAITEIVLNFPRTYSKYPQVRSDFDSMMLRGTTDEAILPAPGGFYSLPVKTEIVRQLRSESIVPVKFYFASNNWLEYGQSTTHPGRTREVNAVFTYRTGTGCNYGVAKLKQTYDAMNDTFSSGTAEIRKGLPLACTELE
jgi:hypothetical protein